MTSDPGTLYRIASITKTFTGTAVMQLRDAGRLDLDDPAVKYLPELRGAVSPFAAIEAVTIRRMLSHESGLATEPPGISVAALNETTDREAPVDTHAPHLVDASSASQRFAANGVVTPPLECFPSHRHIFAEEGRSPWTCHLGPVNIAHGWRPRTCSPGTPARHVSELNPPVGSGSRHRGP